MLDKCKEQTKLIQQYICNHKSNDSLIFNQHIPKSQIKLLSNGMIFLQDKSTNVEGNCFVESKTNNACSVDPWIFFSINASTQDEEWLSSVKVPMWV